MSDTLPRYIGVSKTRHDRTTPQEVYSLTENTDTNQKPPIKMQI